MQPRTLAATIVAAGLTVTTGAWAVTATTGPSLGRRAATAAAEGTATTIVTVEQIALDPPATTEPEPAPAPARTAPARPAPAASYDDHGDWPATTAAATAAAATAPAPTSPPPAPSRGDDGASSGPTTGTAPAPSPVVGPPATVLPTPGTRPPTTTQPPPPPPPTSTQPGEHEGGSDD